MMLSKVANQNAMSIGMINAIGIAGFDIVCAIP